MADAVAAPSRFSSDGRGWIARATAVVGGLAAGFAHPPWGFLAGLVGYALIFAVVDRADGRHPVRSAFFRAWLGGCGYFSVGLNWIVYPFLVDAQEQAWMAPIAVALVVMGMALFWGLAGALYRLFAARGVARVVLFAGVLAASEWLRGHLLTGFPWDLPGETWRAGSPISQMASAVGAYGLTWITILVASIPAVVTEGVAGWSAGAAAVATLAAIWTAGAVRLGEAATPEGPWIRVVQADVRQASKYDPRLFADILGRYVALTARPGKHAPSVVIWPEGAVPAAFDDYLTPGTWTQAAIAGALQPGEILVLGGYRWADTRAETAYNSLAVLRRSSAGLELEGLYDKHRLVPFGEFMPLDALASRVGFKKLVHVGEGFIPGPEPRPLHLAGLPPFQPLICYESLFPGLTRQGAALAKLRPDFIINISNDAWFGGGSGPRQHLNIASYRAIEEGLPMIRATPTGVSAIIDADGRPMAGETLDEGARGVIDARLPAARAPTLFFDYGELPFALMLLASAVGGRLPMGPRWRRRT